MKLISYLKGNEDQLAILVGNRVYDAQHLDKKLPDNMTEFLWGGEEMMECARSYDRKIKLSETVAATPIQVEDVILLAPVPHPTSCRDAYAFRQHVEAARKNRGLEMLPEFDEYPVFYFTNHNALQGPGIVECMPDQLRKLDFELEVAIVIGKAGRNIKASEADSYVAGYTIMNDMSARELQMEEMKLNLGPAKGKDFSTVIGPWLVTPDELTSYKVKPKPGHTGDLYNLEMSANVNGNEVSKGTMADMDWTFAEIIERCSYGVEIFPGDVIGSGTVGTGCFLELNGTGLRENPGYQPQWLQEGDKVELKVTGLGKLTNVIKKANSDFSILALKKNPSQAVAEGEGVRK